MPPRFLAVVAGFTLLTLLPIPAYPQASPGPSLPSVGPTVVTIPPGAPILIGYWLVVEGPDASLGIDSLRGLEIAVDDRGGQLLEHPIRLVGEDEGCSAEGGVRAAARLAANTQLVAVIGSSCTSAAMLGAPILWQARIPTVSPSNTGPDPTKPTRSSDYDGYLRTSHNDLVQARVAAEYAYGPLRVRRVATIADGSPFAEKLVAEFVRVIRQLGAEVTGQAVVTQDRTDVRPILTRLAASRPDLLYYPMISIEPGSVVTRQARSTPGFEDVQLMSADGIFAPEFVAAAGAASQGVYFTSPDITEERMGSRYKDFLVKYQRKYGPPLSAFHGHAYDAAMMIFSAIEKVAQRGADGTLVVDRVAVRNALFATQNFLGVTGTIACDRFGDCADPKISIFQVVSSDRATWNPGINPKRVSP